MPEPTLLTASLNSAPRMGGGLMVPFYAVLPGTPHPRSTQSLHSQGISPRHQHLCCFWLRMNLVCSISGLESTAWWTRACTHKPAPNAVLDVPPNVRYYG